MTTAWFFLRLAHLLGMALMIGAAAVKIALLVRACSDAAFAAVYLRVVKPITRIIVLGLVLATLSGACWLVLGRPLTPTLLAKVLLAVALWGVGPVIDKVVEPRFARLAASSGSPACAESTRAGRQYLTLEVVATGLACAVAVLGALL